MFFGCMCLRYWLSLKQFNFLTLRNYKSFLKNGSQTQILGKFYDTCLFQSILKLQLPSQVRYFKICHSLRNDPGELSEKVKNVQKTRSKLRKGTQVTITNENNSKFAMFLNDAKKYAKRNNLRLIKVDNSNYRLEKEQYESSKKNSQKGSFKKFIVRDSISDHDLQIKINSMLKYVEKFGVICIIERVDNKMKEVGSKIMNSGLQEFVIAENKSSKQIILTLKKKDSTAQQNNETSKEAFIKEPKIINN